MPDQQQSRDRVVNQRTYDCRGATFVTLTRFVGALEVRERTLVASQLPPSTQVVLLGPVGWCADMISVQTPDGVQYVVFASDLADEPSRHRRRGLS
jgi:hypothetical protein